MARGSTVVLALVLWAGLARAQGKDAATADALFREARALMKKGDYETACPKLDESYRLDPAPGTGVNLGDCFEKQGKIGSALLAYQAARDVLPAGDPRAAPINRQISALEKRVPRLTIKLAPGSPDGAKVKRDGHDVYGLGVSVVVNPGKHTIVVSAPGRDHRTYYADLDEGEVRELVVEVGDPVDAQSSAAAAPPVDGRREERKPVPREQPSDGSSQRTLGYVLAALGATGIVVGGVAFLKAESKQSDRNALCNPCASPQAQKDADNKDIGLKTDEQSARNVATIGAFGGLVALAGGVALVVLAPEPTKTSSIVRVGPTLTRAGCGLNLGGTW